MRLLILGSMDEFVALVERARDRGAYTVVCDGYGDGPARAIADESQVIDARDVKGVAGLCAQLHIDAVVTSYSDVLFESATRISHALGLPLGLPFAQLPFLRDKAQMKKMFEEVGIAFARSRVLAPGFTEGDLEGLSFPCVLKPVDGYGSHGIRVVESASQAIAAFPGVAAHSQCSEGAMIEEYQEGYEFNVITWVCGGRAHLVSVADREKTAGDPAEVPRVSRIVYPSRLSACVADQALDAAQRIADFLQVEYGPLCLQFFWKPGDRCIRFGEVSGRVLGYEHELAAGFADFTIEDLLLDSVMDHAALKQRLEAHRWAVAAADGSRPRRCGLYFHGRPGRIASLSSARVALAREGVYDSLFYCEDGEEIECGEGGKPYIARAFVEAPSYNELDLLSSALFASFSVADGEGEELALPNEVPRYQDEPSEQGGCGTIGESDVRNT